MLIKDEAFKGASWKKKKKDTLETPHELLCVCECVCVYVVVGVVKCVGGVFPPDVFTTSAALWFN